MRMNVKRAVDFASLLAIVLLSGGCRKETAIQSLIDAASAGNLAKCEHLIKSGVPVNGTDADGDTALDWAVYRCQFDTVRGLIELGADVNHVDKRGGGYTPLMYTATPLRGRGYDAKSMAVRNQIAQLLRQHGANVNHATAITAGVVGRGDPTLHFAAADKNPGLVRMLLAAGADKNLRTQQGYTPLDIAKFPDYAPNREVIDALEGR